MFVIIFKFCYNTFSSKTILHLSSLLLRYFQIKFNLIKLQILGQIKTSKEISFHPKLIFSCFCDFTLKVEFSNSKPFILVCFKIKPFKALTYSLTFPSASQSRFSWIKSAKWPLSIAIKRQYSTSYDQWKWLYFAGLFKKSSATLIFYAGAIM